jgi:chromosome segregation ATPase
VDIAIIKSFAIVKSRKKIQTEAETLVAKEKSDAKKKEVVTTTTEVKKTDDVAEIKTTEEKGKEIEIKTKKTEIAIATENFNRIAPNRRTADFSRSDPNFLQAKASILANPELQKKYDIKDISQSLSPEITALLDYTAHLTQARTQAEQKLQTTEQSLQTAQTELQNTDPATPEYEQKKQAFDAIHQSYQESFTNYAQAHETALKSYD